MFRLITSNIASQSVCACALSIPHLHHCYLGLCAVDCKIYVLVDRLHDNFLLLKERVSELNQRVVFRLEDILQRRRWGCWQHTETEIVDVLVDEIEKLLQLVRLVNVVIVKLNALVAKHPMLFAFLIEADGENSSIRMHRTEHRRDPQVTVG